MNDPNFLQLFRDFLYRQPEKQPCFFKTISTDDLLTKDNQLYTIIHNETKIISKYFDDSIKKFHLLFDKKLKDFDDCLAYLEKNAVPNKCVCAGVIDTIPGYRCIDCSKYKNSIYCHECYLKSKELHKNHKVVFLPNTSGMCDCGDPDALYTFCSQHSGPYLEQKQIDDYISKNFEKTWLFFRLTIKEISK